MDKHIFRADGILQRQPKEALLNQRGVAIWITGLSGSGKTTIAIALEKALHTKGKLTQVLDGDNIRLGLNSNLGFSEADRTENIRRIAEVAHLFVQCGVITICCFVSPTNKIRTLARNIIGSEDFLEIYVNTPLAVCEKRDVKGLYAKARKGEITDFTGVNAPFEVPADAALELNTATHTVEECVKLILEKL
jgi:adenylylsulfate kinase